MRVIEPLVVLAALTASACGGQLAGDLYRDGPIRFRVGALPAAWQRDAVDGQLAFHHRQGGTISAHGSCARADDVSLDVLTNHLLIGVESRFERSRAPLTLDGRAALRTHVDAELDGVPVALDLVVLKKDGCTYDLAMVTPPSLFAARRGDFDRFVLAFAVPGR